jgi:TonB family protein
MKSNIIFILTSLISLSCLAQEPKLKKVSTKSAFELIAEDYTVLKSDETVKHGLYIQNYKKVKLVEGNYTYGKKHGVWHYYDYLGKRNFEGPYVHDVKHGLWTYELNGNKSAEIYYNNGTTDSAFGYNAWGNLIYEVRYYKDGSGMARAYYDNGQLEESIPFLNRKIDGNCKTYFGNGQLHREVQYHSSQPFHVISTYDYSGTPIDGGDVQEGLGLYINYYGPDSANQALKPYSKLRYKNGALNGFCQYFNPDGSLASEGYFTDGKKTGDWKNFDEKGTFTRLTDYDNLPNNKTLKAVEQSDNYTISSTKHTSILPEFQGGLNELYGFLFKNIKYPESAISAGIQGTVYIQFIITQIGELESYEIIRGVSEDCDKEVIRIISIMPRWNPGLIAGVPGRISFMLPVKFTLR